MRRRSEAANALSAVGDFAVPAVPTLAQYLSDTTSADGRVFRPHAVFRLLMERGPAAKAAVPELIKCLENEQGKYRADAARILGRIGPAAIDAVPALSAAAAGTDVR